MNREKSSYRKSLVVPVIVCFFVTIILLFLSHLPPEPEAELVSSLKNDIQPRVEKIYGEIKRLKLHDTEEMQRLDADLKKAEEWRRQAKAIWDSIPIGSRIGKKTANKQGYTTSFHASGPYKTVEKLRKKAEDLEKEVSANQLKIAISRGPLLLKSADPEVWKPVIEPAVQLNRIYKSHAWYYRTFLGPIWSVVHVVLIVLSILSIIFLIGLIKEWVAGDSKH